MKIYLIKIRHKYYKYKKLHLNKTKKHNIIKLTKRIQGPYFKPFVECVFTDTSWHHQPQDQKIDKNYSDTSQTANTSSKTKTTSSTTTPMLIIFKISLILLQHFFPPPSSSIISEKC